MTEKSQTSSRRVAKLWLAAFIVLSLAILAGCGMIVLSLISLHPHPLTIALFWSGGLALVHGLAAIERKAKSAFREQS